MTLNVLKILIPITLSFFVGIFVTPLLTRYLYKNKMWKKRAGKIDPSGHETPIFNRLHATREVGTPRLGGIVIWGSVVITVIILSLFDSFSASDFSSKINFLSRNQTWIPFATLIFASIIGMFDDLLEIKSGNGGLSFKKRLLIVVMLGLVIAWWFYTKLEIYSLFIPFWGSVTIGWLLIPLFLTVIVGLFSSGVIDGLDGLAGGVMATIFASYSVIAFSQNQIDLAAFSAAVAGATLAFLWFNIPPARFYMSETGILGLTTTLAVVAFLTDSVFVLPLIALPLTLTVISNILQLSSKKWRNGKKVFLVAPLHHHFEALGWPASKVVMRYWIISIIAAIIGVIITLIGH
ncbi:hypothetical protein IT398_02650 [Candidatus Nomurabacteria bacterium]|nr:hypothetical protein [Candidatus Nomurabacteria bacterium]